MSVLRIGALVEGDGEVRALPRLILRIAKEWDSTQVVIVDPVIRVPASKLKKDRSLEDEIDNIARKMRGSGGILILLDCDWDDGCPRSDGPAWLDRARKAWLDRARKARPDIPVRMVLAYKEYESWFLAAAASLCGKCGLPLNLISPEKPETIRDAKGWLSSQLPDGEPYSPVHDQAAYTAIFDMGMARRRSDSFDKCYREIVALLNALKA